MSASSEPRLLTMRARVYALRSALSDAESTVLLAAIAVHEQDIERIETSADVALDKATARYVRARTAFSKALRRLNAAKAGVR